MEEKRLIEQILKILPTAFAVIVSSISLIISIKNYRFNKEANKILKLRYNNESPKTELYLYDQLIYNKDTHLLYFFSILLSNMSDKTNSIQEVELEIYYRFDEGENSIKFNCEALETNQEGQSIPLPMDLNGRSSKKINVTFRVPKSLRYDKEIISYSINFYDIFHNRSAVNTMLVNEVRASE